MVMEGFEFAGCDVTHINDLADEVKCFSGERVVEIDGDLILGDLDDLGVDDLPVNGGHGHDGSLVNTLAIELIVTIVEQFLIQRHDALFVVVSIRLIRGDDKVKWFVYFFSEHGCLECRQHHFFAVAVDEGLLKRCAFGHFFLTLLVDNEHLVDECGNFLVFNLHITQFNILGTNK